MRIGEICQLKLQDIREKEGIDYISVNVEDNKSVKTTQSIRDIPINDFIKKSGFLEYIASIRKNFPQTASIFPYYTAGVRRAGDPLSKKFSRMLIRLGIKNKKITFHSTRHTYRDWIRNSDLDALENNILLSFETFFAFIYLLPSRKTVLNP